MPVPVPRHHGAAALRAQEIEDYLQGFCDSKYMQDTADYIKDGCRTFMKDHHRPMVLSHVLACELASIRVQGFGYRV